MAIELSDLVKMRPAEVAEVFRRGHPIPPGSLDNKQFRGIDLCLPTWMNRILWKTFRKTFYRDPKTGVLRGWNVRMEQDGWDSPGTPKLRHGRPITFGHYHVLSAAGKRFPGGWQGQDYLDYGVAGNHPWDIAARGYCPLVAVNEGRGDLLLGWEIFKFGPLFVPLPDYWALKLEGPLTEVVNPPRG